MYTSLIMWKYMYSICSAYVLHVQNTKSPPHRSDLVRVFCNRYFSTGNSCIFNIYNIRTHPKIYELLYDLTRKRIGLIWKATQKLKEIRELCNPPEQFRNPYFIKAP